MGIVKHRGWQNIYNYITVTELRLLKFKWLRIPESSNDNSSSSSNTPVTSAPDVHNQV